MLTPSVLCTRGALSRITAVALPNTPGKAIAQTQPEQTPTSVGLVATPAPFAVGAGTGVWLEPAALTLLPAFATRAGMLGSPERQLLTVKLGLADV